MKDTFCPLTLVTHKGQTPEAPYLEFIEACLKAGITCVQLREKTLHGEELFHFGCSLKHLLNFYHVPLIVNDDVNLCLALNAFGLHLGQSDTHVSKARMALGAEKIIGLSVNSIEHIQNSRTLPIDYIGVGAIFPTHNKPNIETLWGLDGLAHVSTFSPYPLIAIGGIDESNALSVINSGADGIAAIGAFHESKDPYSTTKTMITIIQKALVGNAH